MSVQNRGSNMQSLISFRNSQGHEGRGTVIRLTRNQVAFEVYNPYSVVQMSEVLTNVQIWRNDSSIYSGRVVVNNMVGTGVMVVVSATLVDDLKITQLVPGPELRREAGQFIEDWSQTNNHLMPEYHLVVSGIRSFLRELSRWVEQAETAAGIHDAQARSDISNAFLEDMASQVIPKFNELFGDFEVQARRVSEEHLDYHKAYARKELHPLIMVAPFIYRTYTKPLGYAGDYEMVNMMVRDPWEGPNTYAKLVNSILLQSDGAQAHRNRITKLVAYLEQEASRVAKMGRELRVLNVGCGPSVEVVRFLTQSSLSDRLNMELMDFSEETLRYAEAQVRSAEQQHHRRSQIKFVHLSVNDLLKAAAGRQQALPLRQKYDFVYCAGLFDYVLERGCSRLIRLFYDWVEPGGLVLATNVHPRHAVRGFLEHIQDWYLYLRNEQDMLKLAGDLGQPTVSVDATGNNVFLEVRKSE